MAKKERILSQPPPDETGSYPVNKARMLLALMTALLGEVSPALRAALIKWDNRTVHLFFFYDGKVSEEDHESAECAATEVIANFPHHQLKIAITRLDYPNPLPHDVGDIVYKRRESKPQG